MLNKNYLYLVVAVLINVLAQTGTAQYSIPPKMKWWYEARFGMFIHFGTYSYLGHGEWAFKLEKWKKSDYQSKVSSKFNPVNFNAGTIARLAKKAGQKYIVITAKHHEGFSMWDTQVESFTDVSQKKQYDLPGFTQFTKRDILQELKDSCDAQGIKFCLYYSIIDWCHSSQPSIKSDGFTNIASLSARTAYINDMKLQIKELITKYKPAVMWFDGDWTKYSGTPTLSKWWTKADGADLYKYVTGLDPNIVVNERVCRSFGLGDFECPERTVPGSPISRQWETCQTMNKSWGYKASDNSYKSVTAMVQELVKVVSRDGNYLLNIGPKGDGTVPEKTTELLESIGEWMAIFGESLYGATRSPFKKEPSWGFCTKKQGKTYLHVCKWPTGGTLKVPSPPDPVKSVYLMNDTSNKLPFSESSGEYSISIPKNSPNPHVSVIVMDNAETTENFVEFNKNTSTYDKSSTISLFSNSVEMGELNIKQTDISPLALTIFNINGQQVVHQIISGKKHLQDVSGLLAGVYIVKVSGGEKVVTQKFVKR